MTYIALLYKNCPGALDFRIIFRMDEARCFKFGVQYAN